MFEVYALLLVVTILAVGVERNWEKTQNSINSIVWLIAIYMILIWFAGTRTRMNDTTSYIFNYREKIDTGLSALRNVKWALSEKPLFYVYMILLKTFVSEDPQFFILITSAITISLMVKFLYHYSWDFGQTIYLFLAFTVYAFTMAATKQTLATSIAIWSIAFLQEKKYFKVILIMIIAMFIHPYVLILSVAFFLYDKGLWNRRVILIIIITAVIGISFSSFTELAFRLTSFLGQDYEELWNEVFSSGVGIPRVLAYSIVPVLSFVFRNEIKEENNVFFELCINLSIVAMCLSIISWFGGAVLFGRLPAYFSIFICISLPFVFYNAEKRVDQGLRMMFYLGYLYYYTTYYNKYFIGYHVGMWDSVYNRVSLLRTFFGG